jgi:Phosphatidylserine/phosphatidylglycerophosphate/cardiolipin synthases and related enzymes
VEYWEWANWDSGGTHTPSLKAKQSWLSSYFHPRLEFCSGENLDPEDLAFQPTESDEVKKYAPLPLQIVSSGSDSAWSSIGQGYSSMIGNAQKRIWITTPYLVPGSAILNELRIAAMSGVDVRILIPSVPDHKLVYWAGRSNIENLLRCGVRIWMYQNGFVHAKTLLMDHSVASVGTAKFG